LRAFNGNHVFQNANPMTGERIYRDNPSAYDAFLQLGGEKPEEIRYLREKMPVYLKSLLGKARFRGWNMLDIGCGEGSLTIPVLHILGSFGAVRCTGLEPAENQLKKMKQQAEASGYRKVTCINSGWDDYSPEGKYDFVLCSHSFYYVKDRSHAVRKIQSVLEPGGRAVISMQKKDNMSYRMGRRFLTKIDPAHKSCVIHADQLCEFLAEHGISHRMDTRRYLLDLSESKKQSPQGIRLLEFYLAKKWEDVTPDTRSAVLDHIARLPDIIENEVGHIWLGGDA